jgi:hypothetical protein
VPTSLEHALVIAEDCRRIYRLLGNQSRYPYREDQIVAALMTLLAHHDPTAVPREELTVANRRNAALNARLQKALKQLGQTGKAANDDDIGDGEAAGVSRSAES